MTLRRKAHVRRGRSRRSRAVVRARLRSHFRLDPHAVDGDGVILHLPLRPLGNDTGSRHSHRAKARCPHGTPRCQFRLGGSQCCPLAGCLLLQRLQDSIDLTHAKTRRRGVGGGHCEAPCRMTGVLIGGPRSQCKNNTKLQTPCQRIHYIENIRTYTRKRHQDINDHHECQCYILLCTCTCPATNATS